MANTLHTNFLHALNGVLNGLNLYPSQHPANATLQKALWTALQQLAKHEKLTTIGVVEQALFFNNQLYPENHSVAATMAHKLSHYNIAGIEISAETTERELNTFIDLFSQGRLNGDNFDQLLQQHNIYHIRHIDRIDDNNYASQARATYAQALNTIEVIGTSVENDEKPSSEQLIPTVEKMVRQTVKSPYALLALSMIKDYDNYTYTHSVNVPVIALAIGRVCKLSSDDLNILGVGTLLHDLGKLKIDPGLIKKPGRLTPSEYHQIKLHPEFGARIAEQMDDIDPRIKEIILGHHQQYDHTGYPDNLSKFISPDLVDIATVADTYDAITSLRVYHRSKTPREAITIMHGLSGTQFNPHYVQALEQTLGSFPVGSLVRLFNNEIGLVVNMDANNTDNSTVRIVKDSGGNTISTPYDMELSNSDQEIVGEVDPLVHNVDVSKTLGAQPQES
ncbi:MAG: HD-GYP domain-containing protein [Desulfuromonas sp.]|nr:HD-GYP domain-containing protein [Desulfuromonas sp.]